MLIKVAGCIDVETTGLSPYYDEVVELAIVIFSYDDNGIIDILDRYCGLREPNCNISEGALRLHGLTRKFLLGKSLDLKKIRNMIEQSDFLVAHNASFDRSFLKTIFPDIDNKLWHCSMSGIRWHGSRSLQSLLKKHKVADKQNHRALDDVMGLIALLSKKNDESETFFSEMIRNKITSVNNKIEVSNNLQRTEKRKSKPIDIFKREIFILNIPSNEEIKNALLEAINVQGGEIKSKEAYVIVRDSFPKFSAVYEEYCTPSEKVYWEAQIKNVRQKLVIEEFLEKDSPAGIWRITEKGRSNLDKKFSGGLSKSQGNKDAVVTEKDIDLLQVEDESSGKEIIRENSFLTMIKTKRMHFRAKKETNKLLKDIASLLSQYENTISLLERSPEKIGQVSISSNPLPFIYYCSIVFFHSFVEPLTSKNETIVQSDKLINKWKIAIKEKQIDENIFEEFLSDLSNISATNPQIKFEGLSIDEYFRQRIWNPYFKSLSERAKLIDSRIKILQYIEDSRIHKLIRSNFEIISPFEFEDLIGDLFVKMGYSVKVTSRSGDYGIDVIAIKDNDVIAIQAKKYSKGNNVGNQEVQKLLGAMQLSSVKANKAILITSSDFTINAIEQAKETPIELWNGNYLSDLLKKYDGYDSSNLSAEEIERSNQLFNPIINQEFGCPKCGASIKEGVNSCSLCKTKISWMNGKPTIKIDPFIWGCVAGVLFWIILIGAVLIAYLIG